jgi:hypothetical protein
MKILEHNVETGEVIERDATADEIQQQKSEAKKQSDADKAAAEKLAAKAVLLERLGISADEAALLLQ